MHVHVRVRKTLDPAPSSAISGHLPHKGKWPKISTLTKTLILNVKVETVQAEKIEVKVWKLLKQSH